MININNSNPLIGIYKIISPSNKIYIGQSINIERRWNEHKNNVKNNPAFKGKLFYSIKKNGIENHIFEVIEECEIGKLNERERYWQDFYDVLGPNGLNHKLTDTNTKSGVHSLETINKFKKYWKEFYKTHNGVNKNKKQSKETCEKKSKSSKKHPVIQYSLKGDFIKNWDSITMAQKEVGKGKFLDITNVCKGRNNSAGGFIWRYQNSIKTIINPVKSMKNGINILQYDLEGNFIKEWEMIKYASKYLNIDKGTISGCIKNPLRRAGRFIWRYKTENYPLKIEPYKLGKSK